MKKKFKIFSKLFIITLILIGLQLTTKTVFASRTPAVQIDPTNYTDLDNLRHGIKNNMLNRVCGDQYNDNYTDQGQNITTPIYDSSFTVTYGGTNAAQVTDNDITNILNAIYDEDNYLAWILWDKSDNPSWTKSSPNNGAITINFTITWLESKNDSDAVTTAVDNVLFNGYTDYQSKSQSAIITSGMNDYQKEYAINDWIVNNIYYDLTLDQHSAYAAIHQLGNGSTVCQGYALLTYRFFSEVGIPVRTVLSKSGDHIWNLVKIDGHWYELDNTWDDPVDPSKGDTFNQPDYYYYNRTDAQLSKDHSFVADPFRPANTDFKTKLTSLISSSSGASKSFYQTLYTAVGYGTAPS